MITFYATYPHRYTFRRIREQLIEEYGVEVRAVGYSHLDLKQPAAPGLHILTDFERLLGPERAFVTRLYRRLKRRADSRVIGNPGDWLDRHQLLGRLADEQINEFRSYRVDQLGPQVRFPVFLRWANEHGGTLGGLISDQQELDRRLARIRRDNHRRMRFIGDQLLVVEAVDAQSPDGLYRKYSVFRIGDEFVPRHMLVGKNWVTKYSKVVTPEVADEEAQFVQEPQDLHVIKRAFEISGIEFGRIDWGYVGGRPQIWEINTNPMVVPSRHVHELRRQASQQAVNRALAATIVSQLPDGLTPVKNPVIPAPERWGWEALNRASRRFDSKRS